MVTLLEKFNKEQEKDLPKLRPGDTIKVHQKLKDGEKERIQIFEGVVIAKKHGAGIPATITVRKVVDGIGVERIFSAHSPSIAKIEIVKHGKTRRSKLYYLRTAKGKKSRLKQRDFVVAVAPEGRDPEQPGTEKTPTETPTEK